MQFKILKTVCIRGNPFCEKEDFTIFVLAHLTQIIYLDYRLVDQNMVCLINLLACTVFSISNE